MLDYRDSGARTVLLGDREYPSYCEVDTRFGVELLGTDASIANLTIRGPREGVAIIVRGGAPSILHVAGDLEGPWQGPGYLRHFVFMSGGANGRIADCVTDAHVHIEEASSPTVERNDLRAALVVSSRRSRPLVRDNSLVVTTRSCSALGIHGASSPTVERNEIAWRDGSAIMVWCAHGAVIRDNIVRDSRTGITVVLAGDQPSTIENNDVQARTAGIVVAQSAPIVTGNLLHGLGAGSIVLAPGAQPTLAGNAIRSTGRPILRVAGSAA